MISVYTILGCLLFCFLVSSDNIFEKDTEPVKREPIVLLPGFASSRLMAWKLKTCGSGFNINIGDRVWLDASHVLYDSFREGCWSDCMMLNTENQTDPVDCKLRPVGSIEAISELDPGQITGPLSAIFRDIIDLLVGEYNYDTTSLAAAPYDWRLPPKVLEERDRYFTALKATIEELVLFNQKPAVIIAHSMGNNVFLYFTEWIKQIYPENWQDWFDSHVSTMFAVGAPLLGSPKAIRMALSGDTFGLPLSEAAVRNFMITYGSGPWMFPLPDNETHSTRNDFGWAYNYPLTIDYHAQYESKNYSIGQVLDGSLFLETGSFDPALSGMGTIIDKYYNNETLNPLRPPERPPLQNVYCIYGINERTEIAYQYRIVDEAFRLKKSIWEDKGGEIYSTTALLNRRENLPPSVFSKSGDGTVSYNSLNWCQTWHVGEVIQSGKNTSVDTSSRVSGLKTLLGLETLIYGENRYDSEGIVDGKQLKTSVIEFERQNHRDIIRSGGLIELLKTELAPRTAVEYRPFKKTNPTVENIKSKTDEEIKNMINELQYELNRRENNESSNSEKDVETFGRTDDSQELENMNYNEKDNQELMKNVEDIKEIDDNIEVLRGNNIEGRTDEVEDIRDDDEGSEFKTKSQGGILPDDYFDRAFEDI